MDRERFGRALGQGTREAARALWQAADAAAAPNPRARPASTQPPITPQPIAQTAAHAAHTIRATTHGVQRGTRRFGEAVWGPFVRVSRVLWLEVTGVFFGLFAVTAAMDAWKHRADLHTAGVSPQHLYFALAMFVVFGWFTFSSFLNARRRSRG
jgi:hypothetical protein